jgi:hypothetical protein
VAGGERQTLTTYLWLTGATTVKPFSRFYEFLGGALDQARWTLWERLSRCAAQGVPAANPSVSVVEDATKKKVGRQLAGVGHSRHGAGAARQEYRPWRGLTCVWGSRRVPLPCGPGPSGSGPLGLALSLKEEHARQLKLPSQSRSALAREIGDFVATQLPARQLRVLGEGGSATQDSLRQ